MDLPALESAAEALERSLDSWMYWLLIATGLVVIGLILEYFPELEKLVRVRPFDWSNLGHLSGAILVVIGVAGELAVQYQASRVETDLRGKSHAIEGLLNQR